MRGTRRGATSCKVKAAKEKTAERLPRAEWNFCDLDEREVKLAFWYEYGRASDEVKREVGKMRSSRQPEYPNVWHYAPHGHRLYKVISAWAQLDTFPDTPFLTLKERAIASIREKREKQIHETKRINAGTHPYLKARSGCKILMPGKSPNESVETLEWMVEARLNMVDFRPELGWPGFVNFGDYKAVRAWREAKARTAIIPPEMEKFTPRPEVSVLEWTINWNMPDAELVSFFEDALTHGRPREFKELAEKPQVQLSFDGSFPFRRKAALQWLGVYRRRKVLASWAEFFALYPEENSDKRKGRSAQRPNESQKSVRKPRSGRLALDENRLRAREEDWRKVKLILEWFDIGTPLNKHNFK